MATVADSLQIQATVTWEQSQSNGALFQESVQGPDSVSYRSTPDAAVYTEIQVLSFTLAAAASLTLNLNSFVNLFNATKTITKALGLLIKATNTVLGGQLQVAPGASNGIGFWFSGTTPALVLSCGDPAGAGCAILLADGVTNVVSGSVKNIDVSNPGTQTITVTVAIFCGA